MLEIVVGLFPQAVLASQRQLGKTLKEAGAGATAPPGRGGGLKVVHNTHRPDILTRCPQQLYNQVDLVDLRSAREKGLMGQQLCQNAANSPAEAANLCLASYQSTHEESKWP